MVAVSAGVGDGVDLHRGERAVLLRAQLDRDLHRMAGVAEVNCSGRVNSHFTGRPVFSAASTHRSSVSSSCFRRTRPPRIRRKRGSVAGYMLNR